MSRTTGTTRHLLPWMTFLALLSGCQSVPVTDVSISPTSSLLAVDVLFPAPLRDLSLVQVFFMKEPIQGGMDELPALIPATFVKWSRAYLLDPEPGSYSVVAVSAEFAPPWNQYRIAGVSQTVWSGTSSDAMIFPAELIQRTTTTVAPGQVAFMGALRVRRGDRIDAHAVPEDDLQKRIAELVRPGATIESGLSGWLLRARVVDLENTSLSNERADRESFFDDALADFGDSPWAGVIAREAASIKTLVARPRSPAPRPEALAAKPQPSVAAPRAAPVEAESAVVEATAVPPEPEPLPLAPKPPPFPGIPSDSPLAKIELGMGHEEVQRILGSPDGRIDRVTAKAWIPFYDGPDANLRDWIYEGRGRVVFSHYRGSLEVIDVVYDPHQRK